MKCKGGLIRHPEQEEAKEQGNKEHVVLHKLFWIEFWSPQRMKAKSM